MNTTSNTQAKLAKKLTISKETVRPLTSQLAGSAQPLQTAECTYMC